MLPIHEAIPALKAALSGRNAAVLVAPPGAGKTTVVPLELLAEPGPLKTTRVPAITTLAWAAGAATHKATATAPRARIRKCMDFLQLGSNLVPVTRGYA